MSEQDKIIVGSEEWCAFPDLALPAIKARIDSGAKTSAIHAINIHTFRRNKQLWVSFEVHPIQDNRTSALMDMDEQREKRGRTSGGYGWN